MKNMGECITLTRLCWTCPDAVEGIKTYDLATHTSSVFLNCHPGFWHSWFSTRLAPRGSLLSFYAYRNSISDLWESGPGRIRLYSPPSCPLYPDNWNTGYTTSYEHTAR